MAREIGTREARVRGDRFRLVPCRAKALVQFEAEHEAGQFALRVGLGGVVLPGKVQIVDSFPDFKVQAVTSFPDLKVMLVESFPDDCGEWQIVESFPDFTIQYVTSFPDFKIQMVTSFPGEP